MMDTANLLAAYDAQMRMPKGTVPTGMVYECDGPILRIVGGPVGRVRSPSDLDLYGDELHHLICRQRDFFAARGQSVEWKLRAHDLPRELPDQLIAAGFKSEKSSSVLLGLAERMATDPITPDGVALRWVTEPEDMYRIADYQTDVWQTDHSWVAPDLIAQLSANPETTRILVAEAGTQIVCAAWATFYPNANFVNLLGGTTRAEWRGLGLYRAMVAARANEADSRGYRLLHVDASRDSAPILIRCGFKAITTSRHFRFVPSD